MKTLPLSRLRGACAPQLALVQAEWPQGVPLTAAAAKRCVELGLDLDWAAEKLLAKPALAEYERVKALALAEYERVKALALLRLLKGGAA